MREEIAAAVVFITRMVKKNEDVSKDKVEEFSDKLSAVLVEKFKNHWYQENPLKGQAYRCIRVNETEPIDPVLQQAAEDCGLKYKDLKLPTELTLWVDPSEVCCRFGEAKGSYCTLASFKNGNMDVKAHKIDLECVLEKARVKKECEDRKITGPRNTPRKNTSPVYKQHQHRMNPVPLLNYYNIKQVGQYHTNAHAFTTQMTPFPGPYHGGDKYRWVRGADLVKA
jgi:hypothetical protein